MNRFKLVNLTLALLMLGSTLSACAQPAASPTAAAVAPTAAAASPTTASAAQPTQPVASAAAARPAGDPTKAPTGESLRPTPAPGTGSNQAGDSIRPLGDGAPRTATPGPSMTNVTSRSEVDALWVRSGPPASGGTSAVKVRAEKNATRELRVGFFEEEVGGSGPMWRAAGWMAVIMSSFLLGIDPVEYTYTYDVGGYIDGPSAGGLMTVATISSLLGHKVKSDVTMTGTINPDGTIGPVGGIPHKIDGAAQKGKTLVLIPAGSRMSMDENAKQMVDVVDRGRRLNVQVREISDIYEAYELLTGKPLPKPQGYREVRPEMPGAAFDRTKGKSKEWFTKYWQLRQQYVALPKTVKFDTTDSWMAEADANGDQADKNYSQGLPSAAYSRAVEATLLASLAFNTSKVIEAFGNGGFDGSIAYLRSMQTVNLKIDAQLDRLNSLKPATLGDSIALADAYGSINQAIGISNLAGQILQTKVSNRDEAIAVLTLATLYYALADHSVELAKDSIDMGWGFGTAPAPSDEKVQSLAELFRRAAEANLNYFDSIVLEEVARGAGVHADVVKQRFMTADFDYMFAISSINNLNGLRARAITQTSQQHAVLGGALNSYVLSSGLVAKYYSIGVQFDNAGNLTGVRNERGLVNMLDFAERRAREFIGLAQSVGAEPVHPVIYYEDGKARREGGIASKFTALTDYWSAVMTAQAAAILSGKTNVMNQAR